MKPCYSGLIRHRQIVHYFKEIHYIKEFYLINLKLVTVLCPLLQGFPLFQSPLYQGSTVLAILDLSQLLHQFVSVVINI